MAWDFPNDLVEAAWGLIANSYGGDWDKATPEWREAAMQWRDAYLESIKGVPPRRSEAPA